MQMLRRVIVLALETQASISDTTAHYLPFAFLKAITLPGGGRRGSVEYFLRIGGMNFLGQDIVLASCIWPRAWGPLLWLVSKAAAR